MKRPPYNQIEQYLDEGIKEAVKILMENGIYTFESCEGKGEGKYHGEEHCFPEPTIRFKVDNPYDCLIALDICQKNNLCVLGSRFCFRRVDGVLDKPFGEITFIRHHKTGTIFYLD